LAFLFFLVQLQSALVLSALHVTLQRTRLPETNVAKATEIRPRVRVDPQVSPEIAGLRKRSIADLATIRLLPRMRAPVLRQVTHLRKASATSLTCKGLLPRMYTAMLLQIGVPLKHFLAHLAFIARTFKQVMLLHVPLKLVRRIEPLGAEVALVWPLRMRTHVFHKVAPIRKIPVTHRT